MLEPSDSTAKMSTIWEPSAVNLSDYVFNAQ